MKYTFHHPLVRWSRALSAVEMQWLASEPYAFFQPLGASGVGWLMHPAPLEHIRVLAMGVVKPANDDKEFWRLKAEREAEHF